MANQHITDLPIVASATLNDIIYAVQGFVANSSVGTSSQETLQQVFNLMLANTILNFAGNPNGNVAGVIFQFCWDTVNKVLYVCTASGTAITTVWTIPSSVAGLVLPVNGGTGISNPTAHTLPIAEGSANYNFLGPLTNGQLLIGSTGADPLAGTITAGPGVSVSYVAPNIQVSGTASAIGWTDITSTSQTMVAENGYTANNAAQVVFTLPATAGYGTMLAVIGKGAGGWKVNVGTGQNIQVFSNSTTVSTGSVASTNQFNSIFMICTTANTTWSATSVGGNLTIV